MSPGMHTSRASPLPSNPIGRCLRPGPSDHHWLCRSRSSIEGRRSRPWRHGGRPRASASFPAARTNGNCVCVVPGRAETLGVYAPRPHGGRHGPPGRHGKHVCGDAADRRTCRSARVRTSFRSPLVEFSSARENCYMYVCEVLCLTWTVRCNQVG